MHLTPTELQVIYLNVTESRISSKETNVQRTVFCFKCPYKINMRCAYIHRNKDMEYTYVVQQHSTARHKVRNN